MRKLHIAIFIIFIVLSTDQLLKIWIKTNFSIHNEFYVLGSWFRIHFIENEGMAFGWDLPGKYGKLILTSLRFIAITAIGFYLFKLINKKAHTGLIICISLIFAGAVGNLIDCLFYGLIFDHSYGQISTIFPESGGYGSFMHGKVVDMLYFPVFQGSFPSWLPFAGNRMFLFFAPVFNIADSAITCGVLTLLFFQKQFYKEI